jgi:uncharacterized RDD family membrane protein YckC
MKTLATEPACLAPRSFDDHRTPREWRANPHLVTRHKSRHHSATQDSEKMTVRSRSAAARPPVHRLRVALPLKPSLPRRLASLLYEMLIVAAILVAASFASIHAATTHLEGLSRTLFQAYLLSIVGTYFVWCWCRGGQTLPMKVWQLRLVDSNRASVSARRAIARYLLAASAFGPAAVGALVLGTQPHAMLGWFALAPGALTLLWSLIDSEGQFLHDRLAGTRIVSVAPPTTSSPPP